jgi:hypothetical protein
MYPAKSTFARVLMVVICLKKAINRPIGRFSPIFRLSIWLDGNIARMASFRKEMLLWIPEALCSYVYEVYLCPFEH